MSDTVPAALDANRFAPPRTDVLDAPVDGSLELASRGSRFGASFVDGLIQVAITFGAMYLVYGNFNTANSIRQKLLFATLGFIIYVVLQGWLLAKHGQTIGKRWLGLRIVRPDGGRISLGRVLTLRVLPITLLSQIPYVGPFIGLGDCLMIFGSDRRTLHDRIADTIVATAASTPDAVA